MTLTLTYTALTGSDGNPNGSVRFTLTQDPAQATTATIDPGDGRGVSIPVAMNAGTGTATYQYTKPGEQVFTATADAARAALFTTYAGLLAYYPDGTYASLAEDYPTYRALYEASMDHETATVDVHVTVPGASLVATAAEGDPLPYVDLTGWLSTGTVVTEYSLLRVTDQATVEIAAGKALVSGFTWVDREAPFGQTITYQLRLTLADGSRRVLTSNDVTLPGQGSCWLSDPVSGLAVPVEVTNWDERQRAARQAVLEVDGQPSPVVLSDVHTMPSGTIRLQTRTQDALAQLRAVLTASRIVQLRAETGCAIEDTYAAVGDVTEKRVTQRCEDWQRYIEVEWQEIAPLPYIAKEGGTATLEDIYAAYPAPATLADLSADYATLLELALHRFPPATRQADGARPMSALAAGVETL
ncbi:hypothetical protein AB0J38_00145 [Streptomyces sp. NPDC050095]|uniref:hypothetical protein n=1 Tax=unclassified Streptomyces TaxID=2593676 RepID=UPI00341AF952